MPELPEVETVRRGLQQHVAGEIIQDLVIRRANLRYPLDISLLQAKLINQTIERLERRAKYLLFQFKHGTLLVHLGMTGVMRVLDLNRAPKQHDHVDIILKRHLIRFNDTRRFGAILWLDDALHHPLLARLGPEPLSADFDKDHLAIKLQATRRPIKLALMDQHIVVGVGNIYASEALFQAKIHPQRPANSLTAAEVAAVVVAVKTVLEKAVLHGGTSLKDFLNVEGRPGYFRHQLKVYDRKNEPCMDCGTLIEKMVLGQRASYFCPQCQKECQ